METRSQLPHRHQRALAVLLALGVCVVSASAQQLTWETKAITIDPAISDVKATAVFHFTNQSDAVVNIREVKTSCGCTAATPGKTRYSPGEKGEITVVFDFGQRVGQQEKSIQVETNDSKEPRTMLKLRTTIPQVLAVEPKVLSWKIGEVPDEKRIRVKVAPEVPIKKITASSPTSGLEVRVEAVSGDERAYDVVVQPKRLEKAMRSVVTIRADWPKDKPRSVSAYIGVQ